MNAASRDYDVVLYGAGGFTGRQTVEYFAKHAPSTVRWAIAGRNREKLEAARAGSGAPARAADILVADSRDQASVDAVVARTRILLSTAGPFALYGTPVVDACVRLNTHYVDITGETWWVREMIERYHERAAADGTRIIPFCGFDSVPSDLGALVVARYMRETVGVPCDEIRGYFQLKGGLNGGTAATVLNGIQGDALTAMGDRFLLDPPGSHSRRQIERSRDTAGPRYDADIGAWTGPFFMAPTNARVVRRSAALHAAWGAPYGPEFVYQEFLKYDPPHARAKAYASTAGIALFIAALRYRLSRRIVETRLPKPGTGPSERAMSRGWFTCALIGLAGDGRRVLALFSDQGDPGNRCTVRYVCESALALVLNADSLPGGRSRGGVLTPATGLGDVLIERLRSAGTRIEVGASSPAIGHKK